MAVLQDININVHGQPSEKRLQTFLRLSQNENGRMINFRVLGPPLPSGCTATFSGTKPDGNVYSKTGTVAGNFVVIQEDMQMTAVAGVWDAKLDIINGSHNIMTALIRVVIDADVVDPDAIASDSQLQGLVAEAKYYAEHARTDAYGSPLTAPTKAQMTDHTRVYVYTGSEPNMVAGNWYYWNGSAWTSGGVYNAVAVQTDKTLTVRDKAADGKATGDALDALKEDLNALPKLLNSDADDVDLDLTDADGNVILRLADGHIKTKEFDSSNLPDDSPVAVRKSDAQDADLDITDLAGNVLVRVADGGIQSANFNSAVDARHWTGKKWTAIGDSLTEVNQRTTKHYHDYIAEATGINVVNLGHSGAGYYARPNDFCFRLRALQVETNSDVVTIFGSGNDVNKIPLGDVTDTTAETLCGCINITLDNIYATAPLVPLGVITATPWYQSSGSTNWTPTNPNNPMELYSNAIVEICRRRSIPCLDLYHCSNLHPDIASFRTSQYSKDGGNGIHPDETGHYIISARFQSFLETLLMH